MNLFARIYVTLWVGVGLLAIGSPALGQEAPDAMIKRVSRDVMQTARTDQKIRARNFSRIVAVVEEKILPHLDMERATALAAGHHWRNATPEQRQQLIVQYRDLLLYTYAGAMSQISDQTLHFKPFRANPEDTDVIVRSEVRLPRRPEPVQVNYRLSKSPEGWKIYDVNVLGVWVSEAYRNGFSSEINRSGFDGLIEVLEEKNKRLAASSRS